MYLSTYFVVPGVGEWQDWVVKLAGEGNLGTHGRKEHGYGYVIASETRERFFCGECCGRYDAGVERGIASKISNVHIMV